MRSEERFSREEHLMTVSVAQAPVHFRKVTKEHLEPGLLVLRGKLITSAQTPERGMNILEGTERNKMFRGWIPKEAKVDVFFLT